MTPDDVYFERRESIPKPASPLFPRGYLQTKQAGDPDFAALDGKLKSLGKPVILKENIRKLEEIENEEAQKRGLEEFKFDSNDDMLKAIGMKELA